MAFEEAIRKLEKLSPREREILKLRCDGLDYKTIGQRVSLSVSTVKTHMGNIYVKLELDQLRPNLRTKAIDMVYCPALQAAGLISAQPEPEPAEPEPVSAPIMKMVEDDETALVLYEKPASPVIIPSPTPPRPIIIEQQLPPTRRGRPLLAGIVLGVLAGILMMVALFFVFRGLFVGAATPATSVPIQPTTSLVTQQAVVTQPVTIVVTATPPPIVSTATESPSPSPVPQSPTPVPSSTPFPDTSPGSVLGIGDEWRQNGVGLRLIRYHLWPESSYRNIGLMFEFSNDTGADLLLSVGKDDILVTTDTGGSLISNGYENCLSSAVIVPSGERYSFSSKCGDREGNFWIKADLTNSQWTELAIRVLRFSSKLSDAQWKIKIQR